MSQSASRWLLLLCLLKICTAFTPTTTFSSSISSCHHAEKVTTTSTSTTKATTTSHQQQPRDRIRRHDQSIEQTEYREYCSNCQRPQPQCLCDHLPNEKIKLQTQVLILQHPVEFRRKTISTVPLLKLVLEYCQVLVGRSFDVALERIINDACNNDDEGGRLPLLLFPGPDAITLEDGDAMEQLAAIRSRMSVVGDDHTTNTASNTTTDRTTTPNHHHHNPPKYLLIIVDGTWTQAKRMLRSSPLLLERCQSIQFTGTSRRSIYDSIRKQPDTHCLSTLESCERTLQLLEPNNPNTNEASHHLLESLKAMVLTQMKYERIHLEKHPDLIRNVVKLKAKKERQETLMMMGGSNDDNDDDKDDDNDDGVAVGNNNMTSLSLPEGYTLRPLVAGSNDAKYVDSIWPFQSKKSLGMITKQILADNVNATKYGSSTCLGIAFNENNDDDDDDDDDNENKLVACIIRHRNGSLGILHVDEEHRRLGFGEVLLREAMRALVPRKERLYAFIFDGNQASEALFTKLGWVKDDPSGKKGTGKRKAKRLWTYPLNEEDNY